MADTSRGHQPILDLVRSEKRNVAHFVRIPEFPTPDAVQAGSLSEAVPAVPWKSASFGFVSSESSRFSARVSLFSWRFPFRRFSLGRSFFHNVRAQTDFVLNISSPHDLGSILCTIHSRN
jgi:hypothetical protein